MRQKVLSITGSDDAGMAGIQADIRTISSLGGHALAAVTSVTVQNKHGERSIVDLPCDVIIGQVRAAMENHKPRAVKLGMIREPETIKTLRNEIIGCPNIILAPGILSSQGVPLINADAIEQWRRHLLPEATLLLLRCNEAELLLNRTISSDDDMLAAARGFVDMGAGTVLLRGGHQMPDRLTALLYCKDKCQFFVSQNIEGWQRHGVGAAMSSAIATRMALGDDIPTAVNNAHDYMHSQVVYSVSGESHNMRSLELYNEFMTLIAGHYRHAHDVSFYADRLSITPRYLSQITTLTVEKSPKRILSDYMIKEAEALLSNSMLTIGEVSSMLGFSSQAVFCKFFASNSGCSPQQYRKMLSNVK